MIITTTPNIENKTIIEYKGIVTGEAILGANFLRDLMAGLSDFFGGRSGAYEKSLNEARQISMQEMQQLAESMGANAIVGVDIDYETISSGNGSAMLMVTCSGTAVRI